MEETPMTEGTEEMPKPEGEEMPAPEATEMPAEEGAAAEETPAA